MGEVEGGGEGRREKRGGERKAEGRRRRKEGGKRKGAGAEEWKKAERVVAVIQQHTQREKEGRRGKGREGK